MNYSIIRNILGKLMILISVFMMLPLVVSFIYQEGTIYYISYLIPMAGLLILGYLFNIKKATNTKMLAREGFVIVGLSWLLMSLFGCIPFMINKEIPNFFDAFFEMASGFTTTGASIITDVTVLKHSTQIWRSFSHWIGGMGVLVFILAIIPESKDGYSMHILRAESPGPQVGKLVSHMQVTSRILYIIYLTLTLIEFLLLWLGPDKKMGVFESLFYSLGTAGTGGFSMHANGLEFFTPYSQYVIAIFMIIFGINFSLFYLLLLGNIKEVFKNEELRWYLGIVLISVVIICINIYSTYQNFEQSFRLSLFQVATIISTTGFSSANFDTWPALSKTILVTLMFLGGMAGSTAGGLKISRINILLKSAIRKIKKMINPRKVETQTIDNKPLTDNMVESVEGYFIVYFILLILCVLLISVDNFDFTTNFTASLACISNVGPGLNLVGPYGSYAMYSSFSKFILSLVMIIGRLELFPILVLFSPTTWRRRL